MESYASGLLRRYRAGESLERLVATEGIPRERIIVRLKAAWRFERAPQGAYRSRETPYQAAA